MKPPQPLDLRTGLHLLLYAFSGGVTASVVDEGASFGFEHVQWNRPFPWINYGSLFALSTLLLLFGYTLYSFPREELKVSTASTIPNRLPLSPYLRATFALLLFVVGHAFMPEDAHDLRVFGWPASNMLVAVAAISRNPIAILGSLRWSVLGLGFLIRIQADTSMILEANYWPWWQSHGFLTSPLVLTTAPLLMALYYRESFRILQQSPLSVSVLGAFVWACGARIVFVWLITQTQLGTYAIPNGHLGWALGIASFSLLWLWGARGRPSPSAELREQFSWMSGTLIAVDACYLTAMNGATNGRLILLALGPLFAAQVLIRRLPSGT